MGSTAWIGGCVVMFILACGGGGGGTQDGGVPDGTALVDECATGAATCDANATCTDQADGYTCACNAGYTGDGRACAFVGCAAAPCLNGATCTDGEGAYTCTCATGFTGATCEVNIDDCAGTTCHNGATCADGIASATCTCLPGYAGTLCERPAPPLVSVGDGASYAIHADGTLWYWGTPRGAGARTSVPTQIGTGTDWTALQVGPASACGLRGAGELWCWGDNSGYQLGNGTNVDEPAPVRIGTALWQDIALSDSVFEFACGIQGDGSLWCWGYNLDGALGTGPTGLTPVPSPQRVDLATDWLQVATGSRHTCALKRSGALWCFGYNAGGQLGDGSTVDREAPVAVGTLQTWTEVRVRGDRTCGLRGGRAYCWGFNSSGMAVSTPAAIGGALDAWTSLSLAGGAYCTTKADGTLWCWGANSSTGKLGVGDLADRASPTQVGTATDWRQVSLGTSHACGVRTTGAVWCWGLDGWGALGTGTPAHKVAPVSLGTWPQVDAAPSGAHTCARAAGGALACWGANRYGQRGDGGLEPAQAPQPVGVATDWSVVSAATTNTCALTTGGALYCWGCRDPSFLGCSALYGGLATGSAPTRVGVAATWTALSGGGSFHCGVHSDGTLSCWGGNSNYQLGDGTTTDRLDPVVVAAGAPAWQSVSAGNTFACGVRSDGTSRTLWCWGTNAGAAPFTVTTPTQIGTATDWTASTVGSRHACGLRGTGTLWCWGENADRQLGDGTATARPAPTQIGTATDWTLVDAGRTHTCGIRAPGTLWCWGAGTAGQLGVGDPTTRATPTQVGTGTSWVRVTASDSYTCATDASGTSWCWGTNGGGQLGDGTSWAVSPVPTL